MNAVKIVIAVLSLLFGIVLCALAWVTWGTNNHMIGYPYKEMAVAGVSLCALGAWMLLS